MTGTLERRYGPPGLKIGAPTRRADGAVPSLGRLTGYAAVFNSDSHPVSVRGVTMIERLAPTAFNRTLRESPDVLALFGHDDGRPIARTPNTLRLSVDAKGLRASIDILDTSDGRDLEAHVRAGVVTGMSFGFSVVREKMLEPSRRGGLPIRIVEDMRLFEVSAVTQPAYPATSLTTDDAMRANASADDEFLGRFGGNRPANNDDYFNARFPSR